MCLAIICWYIYYVIQCVLVTTRVSAICVFAASGTIFATMGLRTASIKSGFMQLLEDHVTLNRRRSVARAHDGAVVDIGSRRDTISAPLTAFAPQVPSTCVDDFIEISSHSFAGENIPHRTNSNWNQVEYNNPIQSTELARGECLPATHLEESFLRVVRAVGTMESLLGGILSAFTVCLMMGWLCATYVYNIAWKKNIFPDHQYRVTLFLLLIPQVTLPLFCIAVGARANSLNKFKRAICDADARGALGHLTMAERANLLLRMTATPLPQIEAFGIPITPRNMKVLVAAAAGINALFAHS